MKMKTLRRKHENPEYREFASIREGDFYTHEHPYPLDIRATIEGMKKICTDELDWDNYEIVEIEYYESGVIGADIRNKLTPFKNLVSLLEIYFGMDAGEKKEKLLIVIEKEMKHSKKNIEYLAQIL